MITFEKIGVTSDFLRLLNKLPKHYGIESILLDIENKFITPLHVKYDGKLYGVIIARGEQHRDGKLCFCIHNIIAEDNLDESFSNILHEGLENWLLSFKDKTGKSVWHKVRQSSDEAGISRMCRKVYGEPKIEVFEKEIGSKEKNALRLNRQTSSVIDN